MYYVHEEFPGVPVLFMSAYAPASLLAQGFPLFDHYVLQKPFTAARLLALLEAAIESPDRHPASNVHSDRCVRQPGPGTARACIGETTAADLWG